jgi:tyrosine-protein phosphatase SIW14
MRTFRYLIGGGIAVLIVAVPFAYSTYLQRNFRNFGVVEDRVLYRSGQLSSGGIERIVNEYGVRTVVTLRDADHPGQTPPDIEEERWCRAKGLNYVRLTPRKWWSANGGPVPAQRNVDEFLRVVDDPANHPVLVHCFAGIHRTGAYVAIYRMEKHRWGNSQALTEMKWRGYSNLDFEEDVLGYLEAYVPRWKQARK